jgi:hypothetical protein
MSTVNFDVDSLGNLYFHPAVDLVVDVKGPKNPDGTYQSLAGKTLQFATPAPFTKNLATHPTDSTMKRLTLTVAEIAAQGWVTTPANFVVKDITGGGNTDTGWDGTIQKRATW